LGAETDLSVRWLLSPGGIFAQWAGVLAGPIALAADEFVSYTLVQWACRHHGAWLLHLITIASLALVAAGAYASWLTLAETPSDMAFDPADGRDRHTIIIARGRFMAVLGLASAVLFTLMILGQAVPRLVLNAC
jgi:hypothetical protein